MAMEGLPSSLAEQEETFSRFCQEQGYQPIMSFVDVDSAGKIGQAEFQRMLSYIRKQGEGLIIVVKSLGHLHPNPQELTRCLLELDDLGARVLSIDEELTDPLLAALQAWSTHREGEKRGEMVREGMRLKAVRGKGLGKPPFGYGIGVNKELEIVPKEAAIVGLIYRLYLQENMGVRLIARYLNEQGITTRKGGRWSIVGIRDILRNRAYLGTYSRFGIRVPDSHPPIISPQTFKRVQERLNAPPRQGGYGPRSPFLLSGLAYCGYCGNKMIGVNRSQTWTRRRDGGRSKGEYRYYQCQSRTNQSVCQYHTRRAEELESTVLATLRRFSSPQAQERLIKQYAPAADYKTSEKPQLERRLRALDRKFRGCLDQAAQSAISLEELRTMGGELVKERQFLEQRLALIEAEARQEITAERRREYTFEALEELQERWETMTFSAR
jgi:DNA invertase Pin-like site-specific DNA recombinase